MLLEMVFSCAADYYLASVSNALGISADNRVLGPQRIQRFTGNALRISFHSDWQINNGFFNRRITARTQILVHSWAQDKDFGAVLQTGLRKKENGVRYKYSAKDDTKKEGGQALHLPLRVRLPRATLLVPTRQAIF